MLYVCRVAQIFQFLQYIVKLHWTQYQLIYIRIRRLRFHLYLNIYIYIYLQKYITFTYYICLVDPLFLSFLNARDKTR
jgi:hypothetical protein